MPEFEAIKILVGSLGGGGLAAFFAYVLFKAYTANVTKTLEFQEKRIDSVEKRSQVCEDDRLAIRKEMTAIQTGVIEDTREALNRSASILERFADMAQQKGWSIIFGDDDKKG